MAHRYFTEDVNEKKALIKGEEAAHLARVLRAKVGERVWLCDGKGHDFEAEICAIQKDEISLDVISKRASLAEPSFDVLVCLGASKGDKMDWALQKCVELGARAILPFFSENTVVKPKNEEEKALRYARIAQNAAKQSGRGIIPKIYKAQSFDEMLNTASESEKTLFFYEKGGISLKKAFSPCKSISIICGAEGGFSPQEAEKAAKISTITSLGPRILRCETAPMAALAAIMCLADE